MRIGTTEVGGESAWLVAEIGCNHQGNVETAETLIREAAKAGAGAVKFQKRSNRSLYTTAYYDRRYESEAAFGSTYGEHREALELSAADYVRLYDVANKVGVEFFATAFDHESVDFLVSLGVPAIKIASGDLTNTPLISYAAQFGIPLVISTGGGKWSDVARAVDAAGSAPGIGLLQCTASYPAKAEDLHLRVIESFAQDFPHCVPGASIHHSGIAMPVVAYMLGARIIEVHFTLDRTMKGTDHAFSLEPQGLRRVARDLQRAQEAMGSADKHPLPCETEAILKMSKAAYAAHDLRAGLFLCELDVVYKSPGGGFPPSMLLWGRQLAQDVRRDDLITAADLIPLKSTVRTETRTLTL